LQRDWWWFPIWVQLTSEETHPPKINVDFNNFLKGGSEEEEEEEEEEEDYHLCTSTLSYVILVLVDLIGTSFFQTTQQNATWWRVGKQATLVQTSDWCW
jgi:DNA replication protein DnaD